MGLRRRSGSRARAFLSGLLVLVGTIGGLPATAQDEPTIRVRYRTVDTVYLDAGSVVGLSEGQRLEIRGEGGVVATVEVTFTSRYSASCRVVEATGEIQAGDRAVPLSALEPEGTAPGPAPESDPVPAVEREPAYRPTTTVYRASSGRSNVLSGVASIDFESFADGSDGGRDIDLTTMRLDFRGRRLGGLPLTATVRLRSRRVERERSPLGVVPASEDRDRLYELSLGWQPPSDRWGVEAGRVRLGTYSGTGWLDGAAGHVRLLSSLEVGAFYGSRPDVTDLGLDSEGSAYGLFTRFGPADESEAWEVFLAGSREETDDGRSRDLVVLESRLGRGGGTWSLFQHAELVVGSEGNGVGEEESRLTQLGLVLTGELSEASRVVISYDRNEPIRPLDADPDPVTARFDDLLRQGLRAGVHIGRSGGLNWSLTAGARDREEDDDSTYSLGLGVRHPRVLGLALSFDVLGYSNPASDGLLVRLRGRHVFPGGHSVALTLGSNGSTEEATDEERITSWARLSGWVELPQSLFVRADLEVNAGDEVEGTRLGVGFGYRF